MENNSNKTIILNIASTIILQGLAFFSGPIFSSTLGTNNYGIAVTYLAWVQIAYTVFTLQAAGTIPQARIYFSPSEQLKYQSSVLSLASILYLFFSIITMTVVLIAKKQIEINHLMILIGLLQGWGMYCTQFLNCKFIYEFKAINNFVISLLTMSLTIGLSLLLIKLLPFDINYWGRILGQATVYVLLGICIFVYIIKRGKTLYDKNYWSFSLPIALPTVFHSLSNVILHQSDKVMISWLLNSSAAGVYALSCTFASVLNTLWNALNNSWVPFYYEYTRLGQIDKIKKHAYNYIELFTIITIGFILLAKEVFHVYAYQSFWEGTDYIPLFAIGHYFVFMYSFCVNYEFYHKKTRAVAIATTGAALLNITLNYLLIDYIGIQGAVFATTVAYGIQFCFHYCYVKKMNNGDFPFKIKDFIPGLIAVIGACVFYLITKDIWTIRWGVGSVIGVYILIKILKRKEIF